MIIGEKGCADEHEQSPDGHRHHHADICSLLGFLVALGSQIALYDSLVGTVFLKGIEDTVEHHHEERQLREVPVIGSERNLAVL